MERHIQADKAFLEWMAKMSKNVVHIANAWYAAVKWADFHPQWTPVEEELPPKRKNSLILSDIVFIHTTREDYLSAVYDYQDKQWIDVYNIETLESNEVTHWMKIVPPRKEVKNENGD